MQLQNKNRIAYLGALTLLFSYAELLLPRFVPFLRLGLGNIAILLALNLDLPSFFILTLIKSVASSMMAGTLISPFFLISIVQSVVSGIVMWLFFRIKKNFLSIYGISLIGSAVSAVIQILLSALYLGSGTFSLLGLMLIFSIISAIITAFFSEALHIPNQAPSIPESNEKSSSRLAIFLVILILLFTAFCFVINNIWILAVCLVLSFVFQLISKRKIFILPHITMWIFVILVSLFSPGGKVLYKIGSFSITEEALLLGISKSLKLSIASALSQCAASLRPSNKSITGLSLSYFKCLSDSFRNQKGNIIKRLQNTLSATEF